MRATLEQPRTLEVPEQRPLIKEAELPPGGRQVYAKPRRRWRARHKILIGMGVLVIAGGIGVGYGISTQSGGGDTAVTVGAGTAGSANSAEHRAVVGED